jgi:hypothetical protein
MAQLMTVIPGMFLNNDVRCRHRSNIVVALRKLLSYKIRSLYSDVPAEPHYCRSRVHPIRVPLWWEGQLSYATYM